MLRLEGGVAEDGGAGDHGYEFFGGHGFPEFVEEGAVVDLFVFPSRSLLERLSLSVFGMEREGKRGGGYKRGADLRGELGRCIFGGGSSLWSRSCQPIRRGRRLSLGSLVHGK